MSESFTMRQPTSAFYIQSPRLSDLDTLLGSVSEPYLLDLLPSPCKRERRSIVILSLSLVFT